MLISENGESRRVGSEIRHHRQTPSMNNSEIDEAANPFADNKESLRSSIEGLIPGQHEKDVVSFKADNPRASIGSKSSFINARGSQRSKRGVSQHKTSLLSSSVANSTH